ncbi:MAG: hypothetical protein E7429_00985 [Ruminococcaceae bacterium]|nr:hypothetical protein [Oscillospiraceae bacterium]
MILSNGKNAFKNNTYSFWEWSAPVLQTYDEVLAKIKELKLPGRIIKGFYAVGMGYNWTEDPISDAIYSRLEGAKHHAADQPIPFLPEGVFLPRYAEIDEPFLIEFEDGDLLCVNYCDAGSVRMDLNTIPKDIRFGTNPNTFHPNVLFAGLIGKEIAAVEVTTSTECDDFTFAHGLVLDEQDAYISKIAIVCRDFADRERQKLVFSSDLGYGAVAVTDRMGEILTIHAPDIKEVVRGFLDEEVLNLPDEYLFD